MLQNYRKILTFANKNHQKHTKTARMLQLRRDCYN